MAKRSKAQTRLDSSERLISDVATLANNLRFAFQGPIKPTADPVVTMQARYTFALRDIAKFLERSGVEDIASRFVELADAINGLRKGTVAGPVRPAIAGGRGPDGHVPWGLRADVVIGLECFLKSGKKQRRAAKSIADNYPVFGRLKRNSGDNLATAIIAWRRQINERKAPASDERLACQREFFKECGDLPPDEMLALGERHLMQTAAKAAQFGL